MGITNTADRSRGLTSSRRLAISARREKSRFKQLGPGGREHCPRGSVRALDGHDLPSQPDRRDSRFTRLGVCCLYSKLDTFVQILVLRDV